MSAVFQNLDNRSKGVQQIVTRGWNIGGWYMNTIKACFRSYQGWKNKARDFVLCFNKCIYSCKKRWQYFNRNKKKKLSYTSLSEKCAFLFPWMNRSLDFLEREKHFIYRELTYVAFLFEGLNLLQSTYTTHKHFRRNWPKIFDAIKTEQAPIL